MRRVPNPGSTKLEAWKPKTIAPGTVICEILGIKCRELHTTRSEAITHCTELNSVREGK